MKIVSLSPFTLKEYERNPGRLIVLGDETPARIICTDCIGEYPIVALILKNEIECLRCYSTNGIWNFNHSLRYRLFFANVFPYLNDHTPILTNSLRYSIANLEPYEKVLVRNYDSESWNVTFFVEAEEIDINPMKTVTIVKTILSSWFQCIPCNFETEELIGTNKDCPDFYK